MGRGVLDTLPSKTFDKTGSRKVRLGLPDESKNILNSDIDTLVCLN